MENASDARPPGRTLRLEIAGLVLLSLLFSFIRVSRPEPPNPVREGRGAVTISQDPDVNLHYDRPADEVDFYLPVIRQIQARWPWIDLRADTWAEKPPGYPFMMATVARIFGPDERWLRGFQMVLSAIILALLYRWVRQEWSAPAALAMMAPLVCSSFFIKSSTYLTTDNPAQLCAVVVLTILLRERPSTGEMIAVLAGATAAASFRQDMLWLAGPIVAVRVLAGWPDPRDAMAARRTMPWVHRLLLIGAVMLPAALVLRMVVEWGALVPARHVRGIVDAGFSLGPMVYLLSVVGIFWWPYLLAVFGGREASRRAGELGAVAVGLVGLAVAVATNSAYDRSLGHWGGYLWSAAAFLPTIAGRSPVFLVLAPLGALAIGIVGRELWRRRPRATVVVGVAMLGWSLACCFNPLVFHRYYEPYALVFLLLVAGVVRPPTARSFSLRGYALLVLAGAGQLAITVATLFLSLFPALRR